MARRELTHSHNRLLEDRDARTLVFDACLHTGGTMLGGVKSLLEKLDFSDIHVGAFTVEPQELVQVDFSFTSDTDTLGCRPFRVDEGLALTRRNAYAKPTMAPDEFAANAARRSYINEFIQREHLAQS